LAEGLRLTAEHYQREGPEGMAEGAGQMMFVSEVTAPH
jgi:hypothetical protein